MNTVLSSNLVLVDVFLVLSHLIEFLLEIVNFRVIDSTGCVFVNYNFTLVESIVCLHEAFRAVSGLAISIRLKGSFNHKSEVNCLLVVLECRRRIDIDELVTFDGGNLVLVIFRNSVRVDLVL